MAGFLHHSHLSLISDGKLSFPFTYLVSYHHYLIDCIFVLLIENFGKQGWSRPLYRKTKIFIFRKEIFLLIKMCSFSNAHF